MNIRFIKPCKTWFYNGSDLLSAESIAYKNAVCATKWGHYSLSFHCILGFMHTLFCAQVMPICLWSKYQLRNLFRCAHLSCLALPTWNFVRYNKRNRIICICNKLSWGSNFKNCSRNKNVCKNECQWWQKKMVQFASNFLCLFCCQMENYSV